MASRRSTEPPRSPEVAKDIPKVIKADEKVAPTAPPRARAKTPTGAAAAVTSPAGTGAAAAVTSPAGTGAAAAGTTSRTAREGGARSR
jgi:hypothetical protein